MLIWEDKVDALRFEASGNALSHAKPNWFQGPRTVAQLKVLLALFEVGELCEVDAGVIAGSSPLSDILCELHGLGFTVGLIEQSRDDCVVLQYRGDAGPDAMFAVLTDAGRDILVRQLMNKAQALQVPIRGCRTFGDAVHKRDRILGPTAKNLLRALTARRAEIAVMRRRAA